MLPDWGMPLNQRCHGGGFRVGLGAGGDGGLLAAAAAAGEQDHDDDHDDDSDHPAQLHQASAAARLGVLAASIALRSARACSRRSLRVRSGSVPRRESWGYFYRFWIKFA